MSNDEPLSVELKRFRLEQLQRALAAKRGERMRVVELVSSNYVIHPRGRIQPGMVYEFLAAKLKKTNSFKFKNWVAEILEAELGIVRIVCRSTDFRRLIGLCTQEYLDWRLAKDEQVKQERKERWRRIGLQKGEERTKLVGAMGGRGNTRAKREEALAAGFNSVREYREAKGEKVHA